MFIELLMMLAGILPSISSTRVPPLERVMRDTLKQVMRCPQWATDEDIEQPVAAFSVARYMQLVALVRKDSGENSCGRRSQLAFHLNNPRSWNFCAMGNCSEDQSCSCFKDFVGEKCNRFQGRCWLFYCRLVGCNKKAPAPTLHCSCSPSLYGSPVARRIYFYDHGFEQNYIPPPFGYATTAYVDSHLIRKTGPDQFEIIGGNYYRDTKAVRSHAEKKYSYSISRPKYRYPAQVQNKQSFYGKNQYNPRPYLQGFKRDISRQNYQDLEPQTDPELQSSYRNLDISQQYPNQKRRYYSKPYKWNEEEIEREGFNNIVQTSRPIIEHGDAIEHHIQPGQFISNYAPRRTDRTDRIESGMQIRSYSRNADSTMFHHPIKDADKFQQKWQENERIPHLARNTERNYDYNNNNNLLRNYPEFKYNKGLMNRDENGGGLYNPEDFRIRRQQGIDLMEQSTIKETWSDDEEESGEEENFKFVSATQSNRFSLFSTFIWSTFITIITLHFLE